MKRYVPYMIAFVLPLGFYGGLAVAAAGLYAAVYWRELGRLSRKPLLAAAPMATITVLAAALGVDPRGDLLPAIGTALLITLGLQVARLLVTHAGPRKLMLAFLLGAAVLAISVALDFVTNATELPAGLFFDASLHNWAGALLAMSFPLALGFARHGGAIGWLGTTLAVLVAGATAVSLSWSGAVGLLVGGVLFTLLAGPRPAIRPWLLVALSAAAIFAGVLYLSVSRHVDKLSYRDYSLADLVYVLDGRRAMYIQGARLSMSRPWLGWGPVVPHSSIGAVPGVNGEIRYGDAQPHNLLGSSETFSSPPWVFYQTEKVAVEASSPNGEAFSTAITATSRAGLRRVLQHVPVSVEGQTVYTFSLWVRSAVGTGAIAVGLRDGNGRTDNIVEFSGGRSAISTAQGLVVYPTNEVWTRISVTAHFDSSPKGGLTAIIGLDDIVGPGEDAESDWTLVSGAQLNTGRSPGPYVPKSRLRMYADLNMLTHFHSWYLQVLFGSGLLGLLSLVYLLGHLVTRQSGHISVAGRASLIAFAVTQVFDFAAHQSSVLLGVLLVAALGQSCECCSHAARPQRGQDPYPKGGAT